MGAPRIYNQELINEIQAFINSPQCRTNTDVRRHFKMNGIKLKELAAQGLLKLKPTLSKSMVARIGNEAYRIKKSLTKEVVDGQRKSSEALFGRGVGDLAKSEWYKNKLVEVMRDEEAINPPEVTAQLQRLEMVDD